MSTTTMNLPCTRFVKRVNNGALGSKYSYIAMMADNAKALEGAPWHESGVPVQNVTMPVNKVTETDAAYDESGAMTKPPSFSAFISDGFDCFQQGGDARREDGTMCGYAGCVAYRFKIPSDAADAPLSSVSLTVQRDRYCRAGVRVALALSDDAAPSDDWTVVRGEGSGAIVSSSTPSTSLGVASWGFLSQSNVPNLVSGRAADGTVTFDASSGDGGFPALAATGMSYLWVYLTLEDYQSYWTMYNSKESRYYSIEGSAMLVASKAQFTFAGAVSADAEAEGEGPNYLVHPIPVRVTHYEGYHRTLRPRICFTALSVADGYAPTAGTDALPVKSTLLPVATWTVPEGTGEFPLTHLLTTSGLRIPEGDYIIEAWIDSGGQGKFTPGDPYGCTRIVSLAADAEPGRMDIELTEAHPGIVRMDLSKMVAGMPSERPEGDPPDPYPVSNSDFATLAAATDRGRWNLPWATVDRAQYPGTSAPHDSALLTRVRVVRDLFMISSSTYPEHVSAPDVLLDRYFDLSERATLTEADLYATGALDLDFGTLNLAYNGRSTPSPDLVGAIYRIVIGDGAQGASESSGNNLPIRFVNRFENSGVQSPTTPDSALEGKVYDGPLVVRWSHANTIYKSYPACCVRIYSDSSLTAKVHDTGPIPAPVRDAAGMYELELPIRVGTRMCIRDNVTGEVTETGGVFEPGVTYYWIVSMLDAKLFAFGSGSQVFMPFTFAAPAN